MSSCEDTGDRQLRGQGLMGASVSSRGGSYSLPRCAVLARSWDLAGMEGLFFVLP